MPDQLAEAQPSWPDAVYARLADVLRTRAGLVFQSLRRPMVEAAAERVMTRVGIRTAEDFVALVMQTGPVFDDLMAEVTVGETYFFREAGHFALLREQIFPDFKKAVGASRRFRAWSAGASTGEEPYSIAIAMREQSIDGDVLGTDISRARLAAARRGAYRKWSFRGVPEETIARYFKVDGETFTLRSELRRNVDLRYLNLASDNYPSMATGVWGMDVIFCRNVLIYFDAETIAHVAASLVASLGDDGWILLGATDPPLSDYVRCDVVQTRAGLAYRKPGARAVPMVRPARSPRALQRPAPKVAAPPPAPAAAPAAPTIVPPVSSSAVEEATSGIAPAKETAAAAHIRELANAGRLEEAGRACAAALDIYRESPELHYLHAVLVAQAHRFAESARAARRALYLDRSMIVAHSALGTALAKSGDPAGARRAFATALKLLEALDPDAVVPYSGGEPAGRLLEMTRMQARLVKGAGT